MKIPKSIKVGTLTYKVEIADNVNEDEGDLGVVDHGKLLIRIQKGSHSMMTNTLLHEIFHTFNSEFKDETIVQCFADRMQLLLKDNSGIFE